jgi:serine/threonine-protein kinase
MWGVGKGRFPVYDDSAEMSFGPEPSDNIGKTIAGRYTLTRVVGVGAMGVVYAAEDATAGKTVALKVLVHEGEEGRERFRREIVLSASISHPNVVPILDHGSDDTEAIHFYTMPLYEKGDLAMELTRHGRMAVDVAVPLMVQACRGVAAANDKGIVHRDIKTSNLFLEVAPDTNAITVKVADFGLAKGDEKSITRSGAIMGTLHYIAPEQAVSPKGVDARADVWSLGMVLYHLLAGAPAFTQSGTFMAFLVKKGGTVPALQDRAPFVPPALARVVHAALLREPDSRWPIVHELVLGLQTAVGFDVCERTVTAQDLETPLADLPAAERAVLPQHWEDLLRG